MGAGGVGGVEATSALNKLHVTPSHAGMTFAMVVARCQLASPPRRRGESGADKRLANILKRALNTPPKHVPAKDKKAAIKK